jgi:2-polyprenyl-6-methoxyphenol hydroxylase-like FAD-dependent oxidoreductase
METDSEVLIAGAGPTGLVLALWLHRFGVRVRIVDKAAGPGTTSRALAVHARTLELYAMLGLAKPVVEAARKMIPVNLWVEGKRRAHIRVGDIGKGLSPYPFVLVYPQDEHEKLLIAKLAEAGIQVERETELVGLGEDRDHFVTARLRDAKGNESRCRSAFLAGCDGAHSFVREAIKAGFPGGTYEHMFYVADIEASGPASDGGLHVSLDASDFLAIFPLTQDGHVRLVGTVHDEAAKRGDELQWDDVSKDIINRMRIDVRSVKWFSTYHVHHRVANDFRVGRMFLLGDAAHIHSPVGGQGMNTGIGDAINLAWKLAAVLQGRAGESVLDTYQVERRAFALRLVATTDRAFTFVTRNGFLARFVKLHVVPWLLPAIWKSHAVLRFMFRTVSQIRIEYRSSALSSGTAGGIHSGDRLPWIEPASGEKDNYAPLASMDWQVHVHGDVAPAFGGACIARGVPVHRFEWREAASRAGYARDAAYLVRPDGYVGWAGSQSADGLDSYLKAHGLHLQG